MLLTRPYSRLAAACRAGVVIAASLGLAACYDIEAKLAFSPDATANVDAGLRFDADMSEVFGFVEALAQLKPEGALVKDGLCNAIGILGAASPVQGVELTGKQWKAGDRFHCQASGKVGDLKLIETNPEVSQFFEIKPLGGKRYRVSLNLGNIPDLSNFMMDAMVKDLTGGQRPSEQNLQGLYKKYVSASLALTRITMRDRYVDLSISAPRIIESNGQVAADGKSVRFRYTSEEMTLLMLDVNARKGKNLYAVVEY